MDLAQRIWEYAYFPLFEGVIKRRATARLYRQSLDSQWLDGEQLRNNQLRDLNKLLAHAKEYAPYYRDNARIPHALEDLSQLGELPVLDKQTIRSMGDAMLSTEQSLTHWWKSTGGSTGEPLRFAHTPLSHEWRTAMSLRGYAWAKAPPGSKQAYIWGVPTASRGAVQRGKETLHRFLERKRLYNCFAFTPDSMRDCVDSLRRFGPDVIIGYTNATYELARFIAAEGLEPPPVRSVLCAAEKVHPAQREVIAEVFACDVFDTYGSREFMLIASECPEQHRLHVNMENLIVEVVDDEGQPVAPGETGRILVTDLHNFAMPFIRYEIGDLARQASEPCSCGRHLQVLDDIVGRSLDVIRTQDGRVVPGELIPHVMKDFADVRRYQMIQDSPDDVRLLVLSDGDDFAALSGSITAKFDELIGGHFSVKIERVDRIELSPSGKHRVTVSRLGR